jgi:hypothetical protein
VRCGQGAAEGAHRRRGDQHVAQVVEADDEEPFGGGPAWIDHGAVPNAPSWDERDDLVDDARGRAASTKERISILAPTSSHAPRSGSDSGV